MPIETEKLAYSVINAGFLLGISKAKIYQLIDVGQLNSFKVGSRTLISRGELERFVTRSEEGKQ